MFRTMFRAYLFRTMFRTYLFRTMYRNNIGPHRASLFAAAVAQLQTLAQDEPRLSVGECVFFVVLMSGSTPVHFLFVFVFVPALMPTGDWVAGPKVQE